MPEIVISARRAELGPHISVNRILPFRLRRMVGPFIFMDHARPINFNSHQAGNMDVLPHPHIGLSTVSYLFGGQVTHRDSLGVEQIIRPGEVNWMTAGKGISHSERFEDPAALTGGLEMIQTWVALPEEKEESEPAFKNYKPEDLPVFRDQGQWYRLIAGEAFGIKSAVATASPLLYMHVTLTPQTRFTLPKGYTERGIYIAKGSIEQAGVTYPDHTLVVYAREEEPVIIAKEPTTLMVLGGEPLGHRHIWWNFVSSRKERIEQAKADWREGRIILPPADNLEFIPLPKEKGKPRPPSPELLS